jgi:Tol biopolymer transport system component
MAVFAGAALALLAAAPTAPAEEVAKASGLIVFSSNRSGPWHLWTVRPDGADLKELTAGPAGQNDVDPCWSPDGKSILFSSTRGGTTGAWRMAADGTKPERICDGDQAEWSPDGKRIALRRGEQIYLRDLAGGQEKRLTPADSPAAGKAASAQETPGAAKAAPAWPHCSGPAWSPDGKTIAFACRWDAGNGLFLVSSDGGQPAKLYDKEGACEPHWSPDSRTIVYETETHIGVMAALPNAFEGQKARLVTTFGGVQRYGRFSPDGKSIVFCQGASERGPWELYVIPSAGGAKPVRITEEGSDMTPDWRP